jgi:hypothetical protein
VLDRCDQLVQGLEMAAMATAFYARIEPPDGDGRRVLRYANAGHPAPLLLTPDGVLRALDEQRSPDDRRRAHVRATDGPGRAEVELACPPGSVLLLYTDGLTDLAGRGRRRAHGAAGAHPRLDRPGHGRRDGGAAGAGHLRAAPPAGRRGPAGDPAGRLNGSRARPRPFGDRIRPLGVCTCRCTTAPGWVRLARTAPGVGAPWRIEGDEGHDCGTGGVLLRAGRGGGGGGGVAVPSAREHRVVAVSVDATELLRPGVGSAATGPRRRYVDVLLAAELACVAPAPLGLLAGSALVDPSDDDEPDGSVAAEVARLDVPELHVHRLGLRSATGPAAEDDLVAALSELVGFDPDPGVYLLGPSGSAPARAGVQRAVQRVARVYGIPLRRYRCHELTVVDAVG